MGIRDFIFGSREKRAERSIERARRGAWVFHNRHMRDGHGNWMGFFAPTNGMTLYTFYTVNHGFSCVIEALKRVVSELPADGSVSIAGLDITCSGIGMSNGGCQTLRVRSNGLPVAEVTLRSPVEDWKTGKRESAYEVALVGGFRLTVNERIESGRTYCSGLTSPEHYGEYVAFFDIFRDLVAEMSPVGNLPNSEFTEACRQLVEADGGLPGHICLRDHGMMVNQVAGRYLGNVTQAFEDIYAAMVSQGFMYGERKLIHQRFEMFALPLDEAGRGSFVISDRSSSSGASIFSFETSGRKLDTVSIREGLSDEEPQVSFNVSDGRCRLSNPRIAYNELERGLRLLREAKDVFCGRRIDFESYAAFEISDDFRAYRAIGYDPAQSDDPAVSVRLPARAR